MSGASELFDLLGDTAPSEARCETEATCSSSSVQREVEEGRDDGKTCSSESASAASVRRLRDANESDEEWDARSVAKRCLLVLGEPAEKFDLFLATAELLGARACGDLLEETMALERSGGVMTADGAKRRAPGGSFMTLVKKETSGASYRKLYADEAKRKREREKVKPTRAVHPSPASKKRPKFH